MRRVAESKIALRSDYLQKSSNLSSKLKCYGNSRKYTHGYMLKKINSSVNQLISSAKRQEALYSKKQGKQQVGLIFQDNLRKYSIQTYNQCQLKKPKNNQSTLEPHLKKQQKNRNNTNNPQKQPSTKKKSKVQTEQKLVLAINTIEDLLDSLPKNEMAMQKESFPELIRSQKDKSSKGKAQIIIKGVSLVKESVIAKIVEKQRRMEEMLKKLEESQSKNKELLRQREEAQHSLQRKEEELQKRKEKQGKQSDQDIFKTMFLANILQEEDLFQEYLAKIIMKLTGKEFRTTKLVYIWNPVHKTRVQEYVMNIPHIVFVIRTEQDYHLAAYTEMPFNDKKIEVGQGAIISMTNRRAFPTKPGQRAISYDRVFLRFGNSEIQIRDNEITSNLGTAGGYYQSGSERADILFGRVEKSTTKIAEMEVYQLIF